MLGTTTWALRLNYIIPLLVVISCGGATLYFRQTAPSPSNPPQSTETTRVQRGQDYYVSVVLVEFAAQRPDGGAWDLFDNSAPDPQVEIFWRERSVYKSSVKDNSLIGHWSNAEIDLKALALSQGRTSLDSLVQGARINVQEGEILRIRVLDYDLLSSSDEALSLEIPTSELVLGDKEYFFENQGLRRFKLRVQSLDQTPDFSR
jgi:hypothetical protein